MRYWKDMHIWNNNSFSEHLVMYSRYIDIIIMIWDNDLDILAAFVGHCSDNP